MGRKSSISRLPEPIKAHIEALLGAGKLTLDELIADLQARFPQEALPSRSAMHRYGQKLERRLSAIRASTEAAKLIQAQAGDDKDARSEALTALVQTELFEAILALQEAGDLHKLRKESGPTGAPRFVAERDGTGHADRAWACFLALNAAACASAPIEFISGGARHAEDLRGFI